MAQVADHFVEVPEEPLNKVDMRPFTFLDKLKDGSFVVTNTITREKHKTPAGESMELVWNTSGTSWLLSGLVGDDDYLRESEDM